MPYTHVPHPGKRHLSWGKGLTWADLHLQKTQALILLTHTQGESHCSGGGEDCRGFTRA